LQFNFNFTDNFTNIHLPTSLIKPRAIPDLTQPFQSEAQSAASALTAAIPAAASKVQSGIGAAASDINTIEAWIPRNCSLGTKQFCVGFIHNTTCNNLPFNISDLIPKDVPEDVASFVGDKVQPLKPLEGILAKVTFTTIRDYLALCLLCLALITAMFFYLILSVATLCLKLLICLLICLSAILFVVFAIPITMLHHALSNIQKLGSIVGIEAGGVGSQFIGALVCAGVIMLSTIFMSVSIAWFKQNE
jgi:hypothetical protein